MQIAAADTLVRRAGDLAERFGLRGYHAVHLAAAESLVSAGPGAEVMFASFDSTLNTTAAALALPVFTPG